jgi:transcriptional regulator with XRE-family HTH domain
METVGERLKRLRLQAGLSQRELAEPGVSYAYISRIEAGTRNPSVKALRKLAAKLDVPAEYMETGEWPPTGLYLLTRTSTGQTETFALYQDETEADEQAEILNAIERGDFDDEIGDALATDRLRYVDTIWEVEHVSFIDPAIAAEIAEQHASETVEWRTSKQREETTTNA